MSEKKFLIIDGNSLGCRAMFAHNEKFGPDLQTYDGKLTGGTYRFISMLDKILHQLKPTHVVVGWDMRGKTFRHDLYSQYKANRERKGDEVYAQFDDIKNILELIGIKNIGIAGYEGDDIVGTYTALSKADKNYIVSGDKDEFQLVNDRTFIVSPKHGFSDFELITKDSILEKYTIPVEKFIDFKALMGDSGDNIPGIEKCGEKTAAKLLNHYGDIDNIINNIDNIDIKGVGKAVKENMKKWSLQSELIKKLVTIKLDVKVPYSFEECNINLKWNNALKVFKDLEFNSFIRKINNNEFYK